MGATHKTTTTAQDIIRGLNMCDVLTSTLSSIADVQEAIIERQHIVIVPVYTGQLGQGGDFQPLPAGQGCLKENCIVYDGTAYTFSNAQDVVTGNYSGFAVDHWIVVVGIQEIDGVGYFVAYDPIAWDTHRNRDYYFGDYALPKGKGRRYEVSHVEQAYQTMHARNGVAAVPIEILNTPQNPSLGCPIAATSLYPMQRLSTGADFTESIEFVTDVNYPPGSVFAPGQIIVKTWQVRNTGDTDIIQEYQVIQVAGTSVQLYGGDISPQIIRGGTQDISVLIKAPDVPGTYHTVWQLVNEHSMPVSGLLAFDFSVNGTPSNGVDRADFESDITLPDGTVVSPGQALLKTWRVRNSGTSTWGGGYELVFVGGDQMGAPSAVDVPGTVSPGETVDLAVDMTAPGEPGTHRGDWRLRNAQGVLFGDTLWIQITVPDEGAPTPPPPPSGSSIELTCLNCPATVEPGQTFRPTIRASVNSGQLLQSRGDLLRNTDGNLYGAWPHIAVEHDVATGGIYDFVFYANDPLQAPDQEGAYETKWRVWRNGHWEGDEITIRFTVQQSGGSNYPPNLPTLTGPGDWAIFQGNPVVLTAQHNGDPDGDAVTDYYFELLGPHPGNSGWIGSNTWNPTGLPYSNYEWRVKVRDSRGAESGWSPQTWHFNVLNNEPEIYEFYSTTCRDAWGGPEKICFCAKTNAGTLQLQVNTATDGSDQGEWRIINELGVPEYRCVDDSDRPPNTNNLEWETGTHRARLYARREGGWENAAYQDITFSLPAERRPDDPFMLLPAYDAHVNSRTVRFDWKDTLRTDEYHLEVSTDPNYETKLVDQLLSVGTSEYTHTFDSDHETLYWRVQASGPYGTNGGEGSGSRFHIDLDPPSSAVNALPAVTTDTTFPVSWSGSDARSGLRWYDIQFRDGARGEWVTWMAQTTLTSALFRGQPGHTYYFRCRAMDEVGNWEAYPAGDGDTYTLVDPTAAPPSTWWDTAYSYKRNLIILNNDSYGAGSHYPVRLHFDSTTTPTAEEIYNASQTTVKGNDVRIVYQDQTELDRFVQEFSATNIDIWFALQAGLGSGQSDGTNYQLYYGNAAAGTPPEDINNIFQPVADEHTVALWHFQEGTGSTVYDTSGRGHDGSFSSPGWTTDGRFGNAGVFNGSSSEVNFGNHSDFNLNQMTLEAWIYLAGSTGDYPHVFNKEAYWLRIMGSRQLEFSVATGAPDPKVTGNRQLELNTWYHIAATYDGNYARVYVNGVKEGERAIGGTVNNTSAPLKIGWTTNWPSAGYFPGRIHHARVSDIARDVFPDTRLETDPDVQAGTLILPPESGAANLVVQQFNAFPADSTLGGGLIIQAVVRNEGDAPTTNGFYTDLYADHLPTGAGDYTGSIRFWIAGPIEAGATVTLTTVLTDVTDVGGLAAAALGPLSETSITLYTQADSSGVVSETDNLDNISTGTEVCIAGADAYENAATSSNLLINGSFEDGNYAPDAAPAAWTQDAWNWSASTFTWDDTQAHDGDRSIRITNDDLNDARWTQMVMVEPNTDYRLSGWIRTENVTHTQESIDAGANLSVFDSPEFRIWTYVGELFGTNDWTYVSLVFNTGDVTELTIAARLGYWYGTTTGTAWFDDIRLEPLYTSPHGDDIPTNAQPIALGETQTHNFDSLGDQDWIKFTAQSGLTYTIQTSNLGPAADTYLYLYDTDGSTLLAANDDYGGSLASRIEWTAPLTGTYYVLVKHWNPNVGGCGTGYALSFNKGMKVYAVYLPLILHHYAAGAEPTNRPPNTPSGPSPSDGSTNQSVSMNLGWTGGDPDGDSVTYDVYFEANDSTPDVLVSDDQSGTSYDPGTLNPDSHYYWEIIATDEHGATTPGPVWNFTTRSGSVLFGAESIITDAVNGAWSIYAADLDGDGDVDVLSASRDDDKIAWYENNGASSPIFTSHVITNTADNACSVYAADVDGDGDMDVLSASYNDDKITWYENVGGSPSAFISHVIATDAISPEPVHAADLDGDGDLDVLSASSSDDRITWYENDGNSFPAFTGHVITSTADNVASVYAADLDGDGDLDVLSASYFDDKIAWYENDGCSPPAFTSHVIAADAGGAVSVHAADVDGDGDLDVLSASYLDDRITWYENDGASFPIFTSHVITTNADSARSVYAADVDGDGDLDVLSASADDDKIAWYESDGSSPPTFTSHVIATTADHARSVYAADVDGDGDLDILSASYYDNKVAWYENQGR